MLKVLKVNRDKQGQITIMDVFDDKTPKTYKMVNSD